MAAAGAGPVKLIAEAVDLEPAQLGYAGSGLIIVIGGERRRIDAIARFESAEALRLKGDGELAAQLFKISEEGFVAHQGVDREAPVNRQNRFVAERIGAWKPGAKGTLDIRERRVFQALAIRAG